MPELLRKTLSQQCGHGRETSTPKDMPWRGRWKGHCGRKVLSHHGGRRVGPGAFSSTLSQGAAREELRSMDNRSSRCARPMSALILGAVSFCRVAAGQSEVQGRAGEERGGAHRGC